MDSIWQQRFGGCLWQRDLAAEPGPLPIKNHKTGGGKGEGGGNTADPGTITNTNDLRINTTRS